MSREDPQLRIRLPVELKEKIELAAKANTRSMNAEIVQRLEVSFLNEIPNDELISAKDAIQIANKAKEELSNIIFRKTFDQINKRIRLGHTSFYTDLGDLNLEGLDDHDFDAVLQLTLRKLKELGYIVPNNSLEDDGFRIEIPNP